MKSIELKHIIPQGENQQVEFKLSFNKETIETLVAFANAKGGNVYVGISDRGEICGVNINNETCQNRINEIKQKTSPSIIPDVDIFEIIKNNAGLNIKQLLKKLTVSQCILERYLKELKEQHKIKFKGAPKTGGYYIANNK